MVQTPDQAKTIRESAIAAAKTGLSIAVEKSFRNANGLYYAISHPHHMQQEQVEQLLLKGGANE
jgi:hypothetical protein